MLIHPKYLCLIAIPWSLSSLNSILSLAVMNKFEYSALQILQQMNTGLEL